jgi:hypothetical protein
MNFSDWPSSSLGSQLLFSSAAEAVSRGKMPQFYYVWIHPKAGLTAATRAQLAQGLQNSAK